MTTGVQIPNRSGRPFAIAGILFDERGNANVETLTTKQSALLARYGATFVSGGLVPAPPVSSAVSGDLTVAGQVLDGSGVLRSAPELLDALAVGQSTIPRSSVTSYLTPSSGQVRLAYFTSRKSETVSTLRIASGATAAGATPTLVRLGLYVENADRSVSLLGSTANDTTLLRTAATVYSKPLSSSVALVRGTRYAIGLLIVSTAALPTLAGMGSTVPATEHDLAPRLTGVSPAGLTDLPATIAAGSIGSSGNRMYAVVAP